MKRMIDNKSIDYLNSLKDGTAQFNKISVVNNDSNEDGIDFTNAIGESSYLHIGADESGFYFERYENNNDIGHVIIEPTRGVYATGLTDQNTKSLFGNQSIYGEGNIDLYKHYLTINGRIDDNVESSFYIIIQSSSNVDCSSTAGATQKLKTLLKASGSETKDYESGTNTDAGYPCRLVYDGSSGILVITSNGDIYNITSITDRVETI